MEIRPVNNAWDGTVLNCAKYGQVIPRKTNTIKLCYKTKTAYVPDNVFERLLRLGMINAEGRVYAANVG